MKTNKTPKITIVIPAYRTREDLLRRAINVIISQIFTDWELLVINDGADEKVKEIVFSYNNQVSVDYGKNENAKIRYFETLKQRGLCAAQNIGIKNAQGDYIFFHDHDDNLYYKNGSKYALEELFKETENSDYDIFVFDFMYNNKYFKTTKWTPINLKNKKFKFRKEPIRYFLDMSLITNWNKLFKTNFLIKNNIYFNENLKFNDDEEFSTKYLFCTDKIKFLQNTYYQYYTVEGSINNSFDEKNLYDIKVLKYLKALLVEYGIYEDLRENLIDFVNVFLYETFCNNKYNLSLSSQPNYDVVKLKKYVRKYLRYLNIKESDLSSKDKGIFYFI